MTTGIRLESMFDNFRFGVVDGIVNSHIIAEVICYLKVILHQMVTW